jgi:hypothetical protein
MTTNTPASIETPLGSDSTATEALDGIAQSAGPIVASADRPPLEWMNVPVPADKAFVRLAKRELAEARQRAHEFFASDSPMEGESGDA